MPPSPAVNRRIVLARRPTGAPLPTDFRLERQPVPEPAQGQLLLRTLQLSLDPYMRGRMSDAPSYAPPVALDAVMVGATISRVETSMHPGFLPGELVLAYSGWQDYALSDGTGLVRLDPADHPSLALGVLGMPGFTAYMGLLDIGVPMAGETVVVAAATGAVGSVVGQLAQLKGCRVVGIAGGPRKCRYAVEELGFDACLDHREPELGTRLAGACPQGIDVYFENVGGGVFEAVLPLLNPKARVPVCGLISQYNEAAETRVSAAQLERTLLTRRIRMQGFIIFDDYGPRLGEFRKAMGDWLREGRIKYREDVTEGLEQAPEAFIAMLQGGNFGKLIVQVA
jgi:NADPH-dependent curcumin reductase CurA